MSALSALALYSSDSECDEVAEETHKLPLKKVRLPTANVVVSGAVVTQQHRDEPARHGGRVRAFPHQRGNWPTFVYIPCVDSECIDKFVAEARASCPQELEECDDRHVSVSRTTVLRYHWINTFTATLRDSLKAVECFELELNSLKIYCNDDQTRTFIALSVDHLASRELKKITEKVDAALEEFRLPKYYAEPSFHVSVLWCNGNKLRELEEVHQRLQDKLAHNKKGITVSVDRVLCKCGNKLFQFPLKY